MENIFKRDYKIEIAFDINGLPHWKLYRKGIGIVANDEQTQLVSETLCELKLQIDKCLKN